MNIAQASNGDKASPTARIHFPVEGHSIWPVILWILLFSSMAAVLAITLTLSLFEVTALPIDKNAITALVAGFLVLEYMAVLKLIVPNFTDYGRYRVYAERVDFFPLVLLGLGVTEQSKSEPIENFKGIKIVIAVSKDKPTCYRVDLLHPGKGKTLKLKYFLDMPDAEIFANELAAATKLPILPQD